MHRFEGGSKILQRHAYCKRPKLHFIHSRLACTPEAQKLPFPVTITSHQNEQAACLQLMMTSEHSTRGQEHEELTLPGRDLLRISKYPYAALTGPSPLIA